MACASLVRPCGFRGPTNLIAGDRAGVLRAIDARTGETVGELTLGAPLTTTPLVVADDVYVLRWPTDDARPELLAVAIAG